MHEWSKHGIKEDFTVFNHDFASLLFRLDFVLTSSHFRLVFNSISASPGPGLEWFDAMRSRAALMHQHVVRFDVMFWGWTLMSAVISLGVFNTNLIYFDWLLSFSCIRLSNSVLFLKTAECGAAAAHLSLSCPSFSGDTLYGVSYTTDPLPHTHTHPTNPARTLMFSLHYLSPALGADVCVWDR